MRLSLLAALSALWLAPAAEAAVIVDQSALVAVPAPSYRAVGAGVIAFPGGVNGINQLVQTVTAGVAGRLTGIDLQLYRGGGTGAINFYLYDGDATTSSARFLDNRLLALAALPTAPQVFAGALVSIDLSAVDYRVTPGQLFSFVIGPANPLDEPGRVAILTGSGPVGSGPPPPNDYAGGTLRVTTNFSTYNPVTGDAGFRTFVDTAPLSGVPEPASWTLLILGFGTVGAALRRSGAQAYPAAML